MPESPSQKASFPGSSTAILKKWSRHFVACVADQGFVSTPNFIVTLILAKYLIPAAYGSFAVAFTVYLLAQAIQRAFILDPVAILGSQSYAGCAAYFHYVRRLNALLGATVAAVIVCAALGALRHNEHVCYALIGVALALVPSFDFALLRRLCYIISAPGKAVRGSTAYILTVACFLSAAMLAHFLSPLTAFLIFGLGSAAGSAVLGWRSVGYLGEGELDRARVWREHVLCGRALLGQLLTSWGNDCLGAFVLGITQGLAAVGKLKVFETLLLPLGQALFAVLQLVMPWAARGVATGPPNKVLQTLVRLVTVVSCLTIMYAGALLTLGPSWIDKMFPSFGLAGQESILILMLLATFIRAASDVGFGVIYRAIRRPERSFIASLLGFVFTIVCVIPLTSSQSVRGAVETRLGAAIVELVAATILALDVIKKQAPRLNGHALAAAE